MGVPVEGKFGRFSAQVALDPKKPETGSVALAIDTASARFGSAELAALKEGFRNANPGQLEEGLTGKMMSRLTGLLRETRSLSEAERNMRAPRRLAVG
jgi:hypothetical protein